jgi:hypothetical protein
MWIDELPNRVEKLKRAGVSILVPPYQSDEIACGEKGGS